MPTTSSGATRTVKKIGPLQGSKLCKRQPGMRDKTCKQVAVRKWPQASGKATNCGCAVRECPGGARRESRCLEGLKTLTSLPAASSMERRTCRLEATTGGGQGGAEGEVLHARDRVCEVEISPRTSSASRRRRTDGAKCGDRDPRITEEMHGSALLAVSRARGVQCECCQAPQRCGQTRETRRPRRSVRV